MNWRNIIYINKYGVSIYYFGKKNYYMHIWEYYFSSSFRKKQLIQLVKGDAMVYEMFSDEMLSSSLTRIY